MRIGTQGKEQRTQGRLNQTYLLVLEGLVQRWGWLWLTVRTRTLATEVLGSTPWCETSQSLRLAPPKSPGRLQCWVDSGQTTNRQGTQPHTSAVRQIKVLLSSVHQSNTHLYPPPVPPVRKPAQASYIASSTRGQTAEARRTKILQPVERKPHSQKDKQNEKSENYVPDEGRR